MNEVADIVLQVSEDSKTITLTMTSKVPFTPDSFITELEEYLNDIGSALDEKMNSMAKEH